MSTTWKTTTMAAGVYACVALSLAACGFFEASDGPCRTGDVGCTEKAQLHPHKSTKPDAGPHDAGVSDASMVDARDAGARDGGDAGGGVSDAAMNDDDAGACGMTCPMATPLCDHATGSCVECMQAAHCGDHKNAKCSANTCSPCKLDKDCAHFTGENLLCDEGECVECTATRHACGMDGASQPYVCDSEARTCSTTVTAHSAGLCVSCISDAQCDVGQLCVEQVFSGHSVGHFCFWQKGAAVGGAPAACSSAVPFVNAISAQSIDGASAQICALAVTTCSGYNDFRSPTVNCEPSPNVPTDSLCGAPQVNDGLCRLFETSGSDNIYRCTTPCGTSDDCVTGFMCDTTVAPRVCKLQ